MTHVCVPCVFVFLLDVAVFKINIFQKWSFINNQHFFTSYP